MNNSITRIWGVERADCPGESGEAGHQVGPKPARGTELMGGEGSVPSTDGALPQDTCSPEGSPYMLGHLAPDGHRQAQEDVAQKHNRARTQSQGFTDSFWLSLPWERARPKDKRWGPRGQLGWFTQMLVRVLCHSQPHPEPHTDGCSIRINVLAGGGHDPRLKSMHRISTVRH